MTPDRRRLLWGGVTLACAAITVWVVWTEPPDPGPLPPAIITELQKHRTLEARADSQIRAAWAEAEAARRRQDAAEARARIAEATAVSLGREADGLATAASEAQTAQDSARIYRRAYAVRTAERDTLLVILAGKDTALAAAGDRIAALTRAAQVADSGRLRADSLLDVVVRSVALSRCTVPLTFGRVRCPTRREAAMGGAIVAGAIGVALLTGRN